MWAGSSSTPNPGRDAFIFGFVTIAIGCFIFLFPGNDLGGSYWYYFFFLLICYNTVGSSFFYLFRSNICSLTTRDPREKTQVQFIRQMSWTLMWLEKDINGYPVLMLCLSIAAIPLLLLEYFYTRERITEDMAVEVGLAKENSVPLMDQMRALLSNKYYVILTVLATCTGIVDNFKGGNVQYFYVKFLLGGAEDPMMFTIYQIATGIPLGLGAIFAYPVARKIGIRNFTYLGYICILAGSVLGLLFPSNLPIAIAAGFLRQGGLIPNNYVFATMLCFAFDSVEFRSHLRLEGLLGVSIIGAVQTILYAPFAGGDLICATVYLILLPFVDVEKKMPRINQELLDRKKQAVLAQGGEWIEPEELERREREALAAQHEADRIADLKALCQRKGLDFDTENQKYLDRQAKKEAKAAAKATRKHR